MVFSIWCLTRCASDIRWHADSSEKGVVTPQIHCFIIIFHIKFLFIERPSFQAHQMGPNGCKLLAPRSIGLPHTHTHNTYPLSLVPEALGAAKPVDHHFNNFRKWKETTLPLPLGTLKDIKHFFMTFNIHIQSYYIYIYIFIYIYMYHCVSRYNMHRIESSESHHISTQFLRAHDQTCLLFRSHGRVALRSISGWL